MKKSVAMELDLTPKFAKKVCGGDGGAYYAWCPNDLPMLRQGNIGAAKLALEKNGFALPCYSDSAKVAYVLQGIITMVVKRNTDLLLLLLLLLLFFTCLTFGRFFYLFSV